MITKPKGLNTRTPRDNAMGLMKRLGITATLTAYLLGSAGCSYAAQHKTNTINPSRLEQTVQTEHKTVDDILGDSFQAISSHNYDEKVKEGKSVVMFYDGKNNEGYSERLSKVFKAIVPDFKDKIDFYHFDASLDETLLNNSKDIKHQRKDFMKKYDVKGVPSFIFVKDGKRVFRTTGGPKVGEEHYWVEGVPNDIRKYLLD